MAKKNKLTQVEVVEAVAEAEVVEAGVIEAEVIEAEVIKDEVIKDEATNLPLPTTYTLNSGRGTVQLWTRHLVTFVDGTYTTSDIDEIEALDALADNGTVTRHKRDEEE